MEYWRSSSLGFILAILATACQGNSQHSECEIYNGITCYWNVAYSYGVHTLIPTPGYEQRYFNNSNCPRLLRQHQLEPCTQYYSHCDEQTKKKFEACETTYQSIRKLLSDPDNCHELSRLRECINHDKMKGCQIHFYLGPSSPSAQANFNASIKLRQCLREALEPCSEEFMVDAKKSAEALAESVGALFRYLEIPLLRGDAKPNNTTQTAGQLGTLPYVRRFSRASKHIDCNVFRATGCYLTAAWMYGVSTLIPKAGHEAQYLSQSHCPKNATMEAKRMRLLWKHVMRRQHVPAEAECTLHYSSCSKETKAMFAKHEQAYESLRQVIADPAKCRELSQLRGCIKQDTMKNCSVHVSIAPLLDSAEENFRSSTNLRLCLEEALEPCSAEFMAEPKRLARFISTSVGVLLQNPEKPLQRDDVESGTTIWTSLRSSQVPVTTTAHHELNQTPDGSPREVTWKQTEDLPKHETVPTRSAIPTKYTRKQTDFRSSKGERHNIDSMSTTPTYLHDPHGLTKSQLPSTVMPDQQTPHNEYKTTTKTSTTLYFSTQASGSSSLGLTEETSTNNHENSDRQTSHTFSDGSQSTTGQPLESISTNKPKSESDQATIHREQERTLSPPLRKFKPRHKPEDIPTEMEPEHTSSPQPEGSTLAAQLEGTSAPLSRTYKPVHRPYDGGTTEAEPEPTSAPLSGVSATGAPAISALVSVVVLSLAQAFRACA